MQQSFDYNTSYDYEIQKKVKIWEDLESASVNLTVLLSRNMNYTCYPSTSQQFAYEHIIDRIVCKDIYLLVPVFIGSRSLFLICFRVDF